LPRSLLNRAFPSRDLALPSRDREGAVPALCLAAALFALNAAICWPLFGADYLDNFQSNEGVFMSLARLLGQHFPHSAWFPWFDAGIPFENTYLPLVPALVALVSSATGASFAHALHFLAALAYCLAPVFLFLFARRVSGRTAPAFAAALLWSVFSPSVLIPQILADVGTAWGSRRLQTIVFYGELPHNFALSLVPLALFVLVRFLDMPNARRLALAVCVTAVVMASNAFGLVTVAVSSAILVFARNNIRLTQLLSVSAILLGAYLLICRFLPPSLIRLIRVNSQVDGGDFHYTVQGRIFGLLFGIMIVALWFATRRLGEPMLRFAILFSAVFGGITVLYLWKGLNFMPQPNRYQLEMEPGLCLLAAFALEPLARKLPRSLRLAAATLGVIALSFMGAGDYAYARKLIRPIDVTGTVAYRQARWIGTHLPGQRVFVSGQNEFWFNLFADNPQLSAGLQSSAPNWAQRVAVYIIDSGQGAGLQDGPISVLWLKAFGCGAVTVPGPASRDAYHPIANPRKFDGLLPLVWSEEDDSVYQVPSNSASLAHVIPVSAVVTRRPENGLDVDPLRPYVAALDDPALPGASLTWENPDHGRIAATVDRAQVISVQVNYDPGWRAATQGRSLRIRPDQLGMMIIDPDGEGPRSIDLEFTGGAERAVCLGVSLLTAIMLLGLLTWDNKRLARFLTEPRP
jgi:hypothetical protein